MQEARKLLGRAPINVITHSIFKNIFSNTVGKCGVMFTISKLFLCLLPDS